MSVKDIRHKIKEIGLVAADMRWSCTLQTLNELAASGAGKKWASDFFFEFWCYLSVVRGFQSQWTGGLTLKVPPFEPYAVWPLNHGAPANFSHFSFRKGGGEYGIYPGVDCLSKEFSGTYAPDISIRGFPKASGFARVYAIWDAKYRRNPSHRLSRPEVHTFTTVRGILGVKTVPWLTAVLNGPGMPLCLRQDGLVSNGRHSTEDAKFLAKCGVTETAHFGTSGVSTRP